MESDSEQTARFVIALSSLDLPFLTACPIDLRLA